MPQLTFRDVHQDAALTNLSVGWMQNNANFVHNKVFPVITVPHKSDVYYKYNRGDFFRDTFTKVADGDITSGGGFGLSTDTYLTEEWGRHMIITDQARANSDPAIDLDRDAAQMLTQQGMIRRENLWAGEFFTTSVWGTDAAGSSVGYWDDASTEIFDHVETARSTILSNTGMEMNCVVIGYEVYVALKNHPLIVDRYKHTSSSSISLDMIARVLDIPKLMVAKSVYNSAAEGATESTGFSLGKNALFMHVADSPGLMKPSAGYTFVWNGLAGNGVEGLSVNRYDLRSQMRPADAIEVRMEFDFKVVAPELGYFYSGIVQ